MKAIPANLIAMLNGPQAGSRQASRSGKSAGAVGQQPGLVLGQLLKTSNGRQVAQDATPAGNARQARKGAAATAQHQGRALGQAKNAAGGDQAAPSGLFAALMDAVIAQRVNAQPGQMGGNVPGRPVAAAVASPAGKAVASVPAVGQVSAKPAAKPATDASQSPAKVQGGATSPKAVIAGAEESPVQKPVADRQQKAQAVEGAKAQGQPSQSARPAKPEKPQGPAEQATVQQVQVQPQVNRAQPAQPATPAAPNRGAGPANPAAPATPATPAAETASAGSATRAEGGRAEGSVAQAAHVRAGRAQAQQAPGQNRNETAAQTGGERMVNAPVEAGAQIGAGQSPQPGEPAPNASSVASAEPQQAQTPVLDQVSQAMRSMRGEAGEEVVVRLNPPHLGQVRLTLQAQGAEIRGVLEADNVQTLGELQRQTPALAQRLAEAGIELRRMEFVLNDQTLWQGQGEPSQQWASHDQFGWRHGAGDWQGTAAGEGSGAPAAQQTGQHPAEAQQQAFVSEGSINLWV